ncbi:MAG: sulfurtransferase [Betaproteobacteria bacterium]
MRFTTLVGTGDLAAHLDDATWTIVDCRFRLDDTAWGEREHESLHVPGASYAHLDRDLSGRPNGSNGRHPLPDADRFRDALGRLGIGNDSQVVVYDQDNGMYASRLWWMLRWLGHDRVAVLDGGFAKWLTESRPVESGRVTPPRRRFDGQPRLGWLVEAGDISAQLGRSGWRLVDARAPERYRGEIEPLDRVPGHIPGAVNRPFAANVSETGTFRSRDELRAAFGAVVGGVTMDQVVCYCGSGVTACHNLLALEHAGLPGAKLYAGSWSEWSSDPSRPVEQS